MNESQLMHALARYLGTTLTPEAAAHILAIATAKALAPIDLTQFGPVAVNGFVITCERFADIQPELHELHRAHWLETEKHLAGLPFNPDYEARAVREAAGLLLQVTMRCHGGLVGHLRMDIAVSTHTGTRFAQEDAMYIDPEHRGGFTIMHMMHYAESCLLSLGVREIRASSKLVNSADVLMRRMKYKPVAIEFCKVFPNNQGV